MTIGGHIPKQQCFLKGFLAKSKLLKALCLDGSVGRTPQLAQAGCYKDFLENCLGSLWTSEMGEDLTSSGEMFPKVGWNSKMLI